MLGSICALFVIFFGLVSSVMFSIFFMKSAKQRWKMTACQFLSLCAIGLIFHGLRSKSEMVIKVGAMFFGLAYFPICPTILELITRKYSDIPLYFINPLLFMIS